MTVVMREGKMEVVVPVGEFNAALWKRFQEGKIRNVYPKSKYDDIVKKIKTLEENPPVNAPGEYYLLRKFVVATVGEKERLACKNEPGVVSNGTPEEGAAKVKFYVALEEIHNFIDNAHKTTKHGGRDKIIRILQQQGIVNVTRDTVELFLSFCQICRPRRKDLSRRFTSKNSSTPSTQPDVNDNNSNITVEDSITIEHSDLTINGASVKTEVDMENTHSNTIQGIQCFRRGHIALLDFSSAPDGDYKLILLYLDHQTLFCILRPIRCKCTYEVVSQLLDIFTFIGPPQILHGDQDTHFLSSVIQELKQNWPECVIVRSTDNYGCVGLQNVADKCISEVQEMLRAWMVENNSRRWSFGLRFVQLRRNTKIAGGSGKSPYERFFGKSPHCMPQNLDASLLASAQKEEELLSIINRNKNNVAEECEHLQVSLDPNVCSLVQNNVAQDDSRRQTSVSEDDNGIDTSIVKIEPIEDLYESENGGMSSNETNANL